MQQKSLHKTVTRQIKKNKKLGTSNFFSIGRKLVNIFPFTLLLIVGLWSIWPALVNFRDGLIYLGDDILIVWILNQTIGKIPNNLLNIFQGNIFFPFKNTMVYSVMLVPSAFLSYLPVIITKSYISAFNFTLIFSQILTLAISYLWFKDMTKDRWASLIGSLVLATSQIHMHYIAHLHEFNLGYMLGTLWMVWKFTSEKKVRFLYFAGLLFAIQFWENPLAAYRLLIPISYFVFTNSKLFVSKIRHLLAVGFLALVILSPYLWAYVIFYTQFDYVRPIREAAHFSMSINEIFEHFFSPALFGLFVLSLLLIQSKKRSDNRIFHFALFNAVSAFILALGPVLKWQGNTFKVFGKIFLPLPYVFLYYLLPGFQSDRTPSRWMLTVALGMTLTLVYAISTYQGKMRKVLIISSFLIVLFGGQRISNEVKSPVMSEYPKVYSWLSTQGGDAILEYPMYTWADGNDNYRKEMYRMYYSLKHKKNLVNGASGYFPDEWQKLVAEVSLKFPDSALVDKIGLMGVDYIIIHKSDIKSDTLEKINLWGKSGFVYSDEFDIVYKIP